MYTQEKIIDKLRAYKPTLLKKYPISEIALFGSFARGDFNQNSDIDILVDFKGEIDGYDYIRLAHEFEDLFAHKVDMVNRRSVKPQYIPFIEKNLIYV